MTTLRLISTPLQRGDPGAYNVITASAVSNAVQNGKPLKRLYAISAANTPLKRGVNRSIRRVLR
jgi:hypothetical protein